MLTNKAGLPLEQEAIEEQKGFAQLTVAEAQTESGITLQYPDGTRLIFESGMKVGLIKQFIPAFCK